MAKSSPETTSPVQGGPPVAGGLAAAPVGERAQPAIRWPRLQGPDVLLALLWVVGVALALGLPPLLVPPQAQTAETQDVLLALGATVVGCLVMLVTSYLLYRRTREIGMFILGGVPAFSCMAGGIILAAAKLTGTGGGVGVG